MKNTEECESELDYDSLDPCCQKEIDIRKRNNAVTSILRKSDKSYNRMDIKRDVLISLNRGSCSCCASKQWSYPLLTQLKGDLIPSGGNTSNDGIAEKCLEREDESEEDADSLLGDMEDFLSDSEKERLMLAKARDEARAEAYATGFGEHRLDSIQHILALAAVVPALVLHLHSGQSLLHAKVDLALEHLASQYVGTMFRSCLLKPDVLEEIHCNYSSLKLKLGSSGHLVCLLSGEPVAWTSDVTSFGDSETVHAEDIATYCSHAHCLEREISRESVKLLSQASNLNGMLVAECDEEGEVIESYCERPNCGKTYPHEHVDRKGGTLTGAALEKGSEALSVNSFYHV